MRIQNAELISEGAKYKIDGSGRIIIPSYMRNKFKVVEGDYMDYFTAYVDGEWFLCVKKHYMTPEEIAEEKLKEAKKKK